ncbi:hypothetical protein SCHPADRAFT_176200 [Schizopora paradoxa]|uniref:Uncharacterized protein n=1 Tax=Schizopora paradoxa TaxID=27342 RepID=A0A0H2RZK5_9AGAM|nr:hypothetical protein SCHPADRAFT_176200 [Schizopora paradoxa]
MDRSQYGYYGQNPNNMRHSIFPNATAGGYGGLAPFIPGQQPSQNRLELPSLGGLPPLHTDFTRQRTMSGVHMSLPDLPTLGQPLSYLQTRPRVSSMNLPLGGGLPGGSVYAPQPLPGNFRPRLASNNGQLPGGRTGGYAGEAQYMRPSIGQTALPSRLGQPSSITRPASTRPGITSQSRVSEVMVSSKGDVGRKLRISLGNQITFDQKALASANLWNAKYSEDKKIDAEKIVEKFEDHLKKEFRRWIRERGVHLGKYKLQVSKLGRLWISVDDVEVGNHLTFIISIQTTLPGMTLSNPGQENPCAATNVIFSLRDDFKAEDLYSAMIQTRSVNKVDYEGIEARVFDALHMPPPFQYSTYSRLR